MFVKIIARDFLFWKSCHKNFCVTARAVPFISRSRLENGLLFILVTIGAQPMRRLNRWISYIECIYVISPYSISPIKMITRPFLVPCFLLNELLFQFFFRSQNILIVRLNHHHFGLKVENDALKLYRNLVDFDFFACVRKSLRCAGYRPNKIESIREIGCHNAELTRK